MSDLRFIATDSAPKAIGPYSQGVIANGFLYTAGQIALDPATMEVVPGGVTAQTERVMKNLDAILKAAGSSLSRVVKTTCFLATIDDFARMNEVYERWFGDHRPARSTVAVKTLPKNVLVEIDVVALV
ncbi:MAG: RidA family protein [Gemmatimonadales bacterium]|nr:RidA family protein [Gemmatimonadales bacterium]